MNHSLGFPHRNQHDALRRLRHALDDAITAPSLDRDRWAYELRGVVMPWAASSASTSLRQRRRMARSQKSSRSKPHLQPRVDKIEDEHILLTSKIEELASSTEKACRPMASRSNPSVRKPGTWPTPSVCTRRGASTSYTRPTTAWTEPLAQARQTAGSTSSGRNTQAWISGPENLAMPVAFAREVIGEVDVARAELALLAVTELNLDHARHAEDELTPGSGCSSR